MMNRHNVPGVYWEKEFPAPAAELRTGIPAFLGLARSGPENGAIPLTRWPQFEEHFGKPLADGYLWYAVRGFFQNGGRACYVIPLADSSMPALELGLATLATLDTIDLICAPDLVRIDDEADVQIMQQAILDHCAALGDRFAILDALPRRPAISTDLTASESVRDVIRQRTGLNGADGALYYPWVRVADGTSTTGGFVPPCGHVAGVYARSDERVGVHKAPANEILEGVLDLQVALTSLQQEQLNPEGLNCLRAFPGRGIRVWGARTLSEDSVWTYVNVRRLFLTVSRWIQRNMADIAFATNDPRLWARIRRELNAYFDTLFQRGALKGSAPQEAFYVKCDAETNPPDARDRGEVVAEIGLAPNLAHEFVVVRIIQGASGVTIAAPTLLG